MNGGSIRQEADYVSCLGCQPLRAGGVLRLLRERGERLSRSFSGRGCCEACVVPCFLEQQIEIMGTYAGALAGTTGQMPGPVLEKRLGLPLSRDNGGSPEILPKPSG